MNEPEPTKRNPRWSIRLMHPKFAIPISITLFLLLAPFVYRGYRLATVPDPGEPFDVAEFLKSKQVPDQENAAIGLERAMNKLYSSSGRVSLSKALEQLASGQNPDAETIEAFDWTKKNHEAHAEFVQASAMQRYYSLQDSDNDSQSRFLFSTRELNHNCVLRGWMNFQSGKIDDGIDNFITAIRFSHLLLQGEVLERFAAFEYHRLATSHLAILINQHEIPPDALKRLYNAVKEAGDLSPPLSDIVKWEYLNVREQLSGNPSTDFGLIGKDKLQSLREKWGSGYLTMLYFQGEPQLVQRVLGWKCKNILSQVDVPNPDRPELIEATGGHFFIDKSSGEFCGTGITKNEYEEMANKSLLAVHGLLEYLQPNPEWYFSRHDRTLTRQHLLEIALLLEIYFQNEGQYPELLVELFDDPADVPTDIYSPTRDAIRYRRESSRSCFLWSIGQDRIDHGFDFEDQKILSSHQWQPNGTGGEDVVDDLGIELGKHRIPSE